MKYFFKSFVIPTPYSIKYGMSIIETEKEYLVFKAGQIVLFYKEITKEEFEEILESGVMKKEN